MKSSPTQPSALVGVIVYSTTSTDPLILVNVSVISGNVDNTNVSPVTFTLSVANQLKVVFVKFTSAVKSCAKVTSLHTTSVGAIALFGSGFTVTV